MNDAAGGGPLTLLQERLRPFFKTNPQSALAELSAPKECFAIAKPWGDDSFALEIDDGSTELIEALNNVALPKRHTAIWHKDSRNFEVIWTAYRVAPSINDLPTREFTFKFRGKDYKCGFGGSSPRLVAIARAALPTGASNTEYRNLFSFKMHATQADEPDHPYSSYLDQPRSFWIKDVEWNEDDASFVDLINHLNFYMTYYDTRTPRIFVHDPAVEDAPSNAPMRFKPEGFPKIIQARELDSSAFYFWEASLTGDAARRFIYNYQIIEYSVFYFIEEGVKRSLRRILASPTASDNIELTLRQVSDAFGLAKMQEPQRMDAFLKATVDPVLVWREIENNLPSFTSSVNFDGGFVLEPLAKIGWKEGDFSHSWLPSFSNTIRGIRSALSHGREQRQLRVIAPTRRNHQLLRPWVAPITVVAQQVMHYHDV